MLTDDDGKRLTAEEAKEYLLDELAKGHEVLPLGECTNFDWKTGCKGHDYVKCSRCNKELPEYKVNEIGLCEGCESQQFTEDMEISREEWDNLSYY